MRILVLSDLHREIWGEDAPRIDISASMPDIVVLAGDIHTGFSAVRWAAEAFTGVPVIYVPGNHEFYGAKYDRVGPAIRAACEPHKNIHFLDCDEYICDGVRFIGATLWTDFLLFGDAPKHLAMSECHHFLNDYRAVKFKSQQGYRRMHPVDTERVHSEQRQWLERKLDESFQGKTVVVTHMAPSKLSIAPRWSKSLVSAAFASNLDDLVSRADLWVHGHTHDSVEYRIGHCRVVANPRGYPQRDGSAENKQFSPTFVVDL